MCMHFVVGFFCHSFLITENFGGFNFNFTFYFHYLVLYDRLPAEILVRMFHRHNKFRVKCRGECEEFHSMVKKSHKSACDKLNGMMNVFEYVKNVVVSGVKWGDQLPRERQPSNCHSGTFKHTILFKCSLKTIELLCFSVLIRNGIFLFPFNVLRSLINNTHTLCTEH